MIGVLGGTFDPIHYGHLRPAHEVCRRLRLDSLRLVPASTPPHRPPPVATPEQRLRMVELAVPEFPGLMADDHEVRRGGVSYTVPTLESLRAEIGVESLCFVLGSDAFAGLPAWHRWQEIFALAHLVVMHRPGASMHETDSVPLWAAGRLCQGVEELADRPAGGVLFITVTPLDISATRLRAHITRGETPDPHQLPPAVWEYIRRHGIYRSPPA